jgi:hypothetical protein
MTPVQETACAPPHPPCWPCNRPGDICWNTAIAPRAWWMSAWPVPGGAAWPRAWPHRARQRPTCPAPATCARPWPGNHSLLSAFAPHHGIPVRPGAPQPQRGGAGRPCGHAHAHPGQPRLCGQGRARGADLRRLVARIPPGHQRHRHRAGRRAAVEVHGGEHFLERNSFLTCAASPILSATGELLGILDISGDHRNGHAHTLGLVSTAARMIENRLLVATCKRNIRLHLHREPEGIGSVAEGIVAVSADGWIVGANRVALTQLGLHMGDVGATPLAQVLDVRLDDLLSHHHRRPQQPQALRLRGGALLYAQVQLDAAAWPAAPGCAAHGCPRLPAPTTHWPGWTPATPAGAPPPTRPAAWWASPLRCSSRANRAWARKCLRAPCTPAAHAAPGLLWPSTARPSPSTSSNPSCSAMWPAPSPAPARKAAWAACARPTAARCSSMKSATCRCPCKPACCACCKTAA